MQENSVIDVFFENDIDWASCFTWKKSDQALPEATRSRTLWETPNQKSKAFSDASSTKDFDTIGGPSKSLRTWTKENGNSFNLHKTDTEALSLEDTATAILDNFSELHVNECKAKSQVATEEAQKGTSEVMPDKVQMRNKRFRETVRYDEASKKKPQDVLDGVIKYMSRRNKTNMKEGETGAVYIFHDFGLHREGTEMVKIGFYRSGRNTPPNRCVTINRECNARLRVFDTSIVGKMHLDTAYLLEQLVHKDLLPHRVYHQCDCRGGTEHKEYFQLEPQIAVNTLKMWCKWLEYKPSPFARIDDRWELTRVWRDRLAKLDTNTLKSESNNDHEKRLEWWSTFFKPAVSETDETRVKVKKEVISDQLQQFAAKSLIPEPFIFGGQQGANKMSPATDYSTKSPEAKDFFSNFGATSPRPYTPSFPAKSRSPSVFATKEEPSEININDIPTQQHEQQPCDQNIKYQSAYVESEKASTPHDLPSERKASPGANTPLEPSSYSPESPLERKSASGMKTSRERLSLSPDKLDSLNNKTANNVNAAEVVAINDLQRVISFLHGELNRVQPMIPHRTILQDLIQFRWAVICYFVLAMSSSYLPPGLSIVFWAAFLPMFLAELRGWNIGDGVTKRTKVPL